MLLCYRGRFHDELDLKLAWSAFGVAVIQFALLVEPVQTMDANWRWGMVFTDHILFLASCEYRLRQQRGLRSTVCWCCLLVHVVCGVAGLVWCWREPERMFFFMS